MFQKLNGKRERIKNENLKSEKRTNKKLSQRIFSSVQYRVITFIFSFENSNSTKQLTLILIYLESYTIRNS